MTDCEELDAEALKLEVSNLQSKIDEANKNLDSVKQEHEQLKQEYDSAKKELDEYRRREADSLIKEIIADSEYKEDELTEKGLDELREIRDVLAKAKKTASVNRAGQSNDSNPTRQLTVGRWDSTTGKWVN